jgi:hypothetical protein
VVYVCKGAIVVTLAARAERSPYLNLDFGAGEGEGFLHPVVEAEDGGALFVGGALGGVLGETQGAESDGAGGGEIGLEGLLDFGADQRREEALEEFVFQAEKALGYAGFALAGAAAEQLAIDAAGIVAFGGDDAEAAEFDDAFVEANVGAATGHVGGDGDAAGVAGGATMIASSWWRMALRTVTSRPRARSCCASSSLAWTLRVPTSIGWRVAWTRSISATMADHFSSAVAKTWSGRCLRMQGRLGGIATTGSL